MREQKRIFRAFLAIILLFATASALLYPDVVKSSAGMNSRNEPNVNDKVESEEDSQYEGWVSYENKQLGFTVYYPEGWSVLEPDLYDPAVYSYPTRFPVTFALIENGPSTAMNAETNVINGIGRSWMFRVEFEWNGSEKSLEEIADELSVQTGGEYEEYEIDGVRALKIEQVPAAPGKIGPVYILDYGTYIVHLTYMALGEPERIDEYQTDFEEKFITSFDRADYE